MLGFAQFWVQKLHGAHFFHHHELVLKGAGGMPRILLAEDNPADVYLIRMALEQHGVNFPLQLASDGAEVLRIIDQQESLAETELSLIVLDLNLPRHDGIEILERLRGTERLTLVPVIVLTSSDSPRDRNLANGLGTARFLRKPSNLEEFLSLGAVFKELLGQAKAQSNGI